MGQRDPWDMVGQKHLPLAGTSLVYEDQESGVYQLTFSGDRVDWECIQGPFRGETGAAPYHAARVDGETLLMAWSQESGETTTLLAKTAERLALVCHAYGGECEIVSAKIVAWTPPNSSPRGSSSPKGRPKKRRQHPTSRQRTT